MDIATADERGFAALERTVWRTAGARFNAARRLQRRDTISTLAISLSSLWALGGALLAITFERVLIRDEIALLNVATILSSVMILILAMFEKGKGYEIKANRLFRCGNELLSLRVLIRGTASDRPESPRSDMHSELARQYGELLTRNEENHDPIDDQLFRAQHRLEFGLRWEMALGFRVKSWVQGYALYLFLILVPGAFLGFVVFRLASRISGASGSGDFLSGVN